MIPVAAAGLVAAFVALCVCFRKEIADNTPGRGPHAEPRGPLKRAEKLALKEAEVRSQAQLQPPDAPNLNLKTKLGDSEERAVAHYIRTGDGSGLRASNANDMTLADNTYAGYTVPTGYYAKITTKRNEGMLSEVLGVQRIPGTGTTTNAPYDNGTANVFASTAETTAFDLDAPVVGQKAFTLVKYSKQVILSYELLQDEDARLMDFVNNYVCLLYTSRCV